ncbi:MAG: hypothetical protein MUE64_06815 [Ignavibacteriaceae bacterium]|nr:hypothetical protein [Ignavibacteriaceae bacterium]
MKYVLFVLLLTAFLFYSVFAEENNLITGTTSSSQTTQPPSAESKWYYDYFYLGVYPLVGYKVTPKLSLGAKIGYAYVSDDRYEPFPALKTSNYGGSIFSRYRIIPQLYAHAEFAYWSYESINSFNTLENTYNTDRYWVPYLLLGGGFSQNVGPNVWLFAEVLFDVINDENSPYESGDPFVSFGVGVGF